jgi:hypothetical protein
VASSGVRATHATATLRGALVFVEAAPRAVLLGPGDSVVKAICTYRAAHADLLCLTLTNLALGLAFAVRAEEEHEVFPPARGGVLPAPAGPGEVCLPTYLSHETLTSLVLLSNFGHGRWKYFGSAESSNV